MSVVLCGVHPGAHQMSDECDYPHYIAPGGDLPSMTAVETLDPREAVTS